MSDQENIFVMWGGSGHAKVLAEIIYLREDKIAMLFDNKPAISSPLQGVPIGFGQKDFDIWLEQMKDPSTISAISAIGGSLGAARCQFLKLFRKSGLKTPSLIHPTAHVAADVSIADNCQVLAKAVVCADVSLGAATIINTAASVDHECQISKGVHISPGATLCGCINVGQHTTIGAGAIVLPNINIGENSIIGAGAIVTKDIPSSVVAYGQPAIIKRENKDA